MKQHNIAAVLRLVKNIFARHWKRWLPYGVILLILASVWCLWDGISSERQNVIREKKDLRPSSPVFSAPHDGGAAGQDKGRLIVSSAQAARRRPLPDLFAPAEHIAVPAERGKEKGSASGESIRLCGIISYGGAAAAVLEIDGKAGTCAAGEGFEGYTVLYVGSSAVDLEKQGRVISLTMDRAFLPD